MKPSNLQRKAPMKRTPFRSKPAVFGAVRATGKPRARLMKSKGPRMTPIRKAARGQDCTIRIPGVCNFDPDTTVLCHDNRLAAGKGMGLKAPDTAAAFGCSACHDVLDGRRPRPEWLTYDALMLAFDAAVARTHEILKSMGVMK